jgi:hypothetical protein
MLSVGNTLVGGGASLSLDTRVAVGAGVFAVSPAETSAAVAETPVVTTPDQKIPAYNAIEFSYRSDFGKVILLQQNVETGQEVTQVPTEYHLRQYAATQREQRVQVQQKLYRGAAGQEQAKSAAPTVVVTTGTKPAVSPSGPSEPAASPSVAPSVAPSTAAPSTVATAAAVHVDIKA